MEGVCAGEQSSSKLDLGLNVVVVDSGPFRMRHLSRPPSPPGQRSFPRTIPTISARDVVVSLIGSEYDRKIFERHQNQFSVLLQSLHRTWRSCLP